MRRWFHSCRGTKVEGRFRNLSLLKRLSLFSRFLLTSCFHLRNFASITLSDLGVRLGFPGQFRLDGTLFPELRALQLLPFLDLFALKALFFRSKAFVTKFLRGFNVLPSERDFLGQVFEGYLSVGNRLFGLTRCTCTCLKRSFFLAGK